MAARRWVIDSPGGTGPLEALALVLWHGAGGDIDEPTLVETAERFAAGGAAVARARFAYRREGRRMPDRMPALMIDAEKTVAGLRKKLDRPALILGGRSMGGRVASMIAAQGYPASGLLLLSYPLHPEGRPTELRDGHLPAIRCPMLFLSGDRDDLARRDLLEAVVAKLGARARLELFSGADHTLRKKADQRRAAEIASDWARRLDPSHGPI
jgi:hypothetical protein